MKEGVEGRLEEVLCRSRSKWPKLNSFGRRQGEGDGLRDGVSSELWVDGQGGRQVLTEMGLWKIELTFTGHLGLMIGFIYKVQSEVK